MAGLLDAFNTDDARFGLGLLAAAGPSQLSFGQRLQGALGSFDEFKKDQARAKLFDTQMQMGMLGLDKAKREAENERGLAALMPQFFSAGSAGSPGTAAVNGALPPELRIGALSATPAQAPKFDVKGFTAAAVNSGYMNPLDAIKLQQQLAKETPINKLDVKDFTPASVQKFAQTGNYADLERLDKLHFADTGGQITGLNPFTGQPVGAAPKTGNPFSDLVLSDGQGGFRPNSPLLGAKQSIAKAGATQVRIENKTGESLAKEIGPMMTESAGAATGAVQQIDAANRIISAVDSNKVFAGPGASIRLKTAQIADVLGIAGKDEAEKIANTRSTIRGLAEMTLQGRKQMRGQGAITESESALAEKAISGNIDDLTPAEIKQLANASARSARFVYDQHQKKLGVVRNNPNTAQLAPFYEAMPLPESSGAQLSPAAPNAPASPNIDALLQKYGG